MQDALYFRSQAAIYFELARRMSLADDADVFRVLGREFIARAEQFEAGGDSVSSLFHSGTG